MDVFSRTFLPAAAEAGLAIPTVSRHMPIFRRCVEPDDATVLVNRCVRPDEPMAGDFMLLLTSRRLVVTQESKVFHRLRLHLNANLRHLTNVSWSPDLGRPAIELVATAVDGVRERFRMRLGEPEAVWHIDTLLHHIFRNPHVAEVPTQAAPSRRSASPIRPAAAPAAA
jgi:hypothetical protein